VLLVGEPVGILDEDKKEWPHLCLSSSLSGPQSLREQSVSKELQAVRGEFNKILFVAGLRQQKNFKRWMSADLDASLVIVGKECRVFGG